MLLNDKTNSKRTALLKKKKHRNSNQDYVFIPRLALTGPPARKTWQNDYDNSNKLTYNGHFNVAFPCFATSSSSLNKQLTPKYSFITSSYSKDIQSDIIWNPV